MRVCVSCSSTFVDLGSKERHKATTRNGIPQGVLSYLSLMLLWLRDIIYIRPKGLFFLCEMVLLDVMHVLYM